MSQTVTRLYPQPAREFALEGLYLSHNLRQQTVSRSGTFVYSNYITSLDGRIAVSRPSSSKLVVPKAITNPRDWRLFQELAIQADVLITSGRYLRQYERGEVQEILTVFDEPRFADLMEWRRGKELSPRPDLVVISASLDFPIPASLTSSGRKVIVLTVESAEQNRIAELKKQSGEVFIAGEQKVSGRKAVEILSGLGYKLIYNATGPKVLHLLLKDNMLDRLYLSFASRILGGDPYASIVEGDLLDPPQDFRLNSIYHDPQALNGLGQLFCSYNIVR
ncbi:MAG: RibD family protein [Anaerolineales bacterium]|jgi:riboflavin biosynthesis pyrimidine reductase